MTEKLIYVKHQDSPHAHRVEAVLTIIDMILFSLLPT